MAAPNRMKMVIPVYGTGQGTKTDVKLVLTIHTSASFHTVHKVVLGSRAHTGAKMCWQCQLPLTPLARLSKFLFDTSPNHHTSQRPGITELG